MKLLLISPLPPPVGGIANWTEDILNYSKEYCDKLNVIHLNSSLILRKITDLRLGSRIIYGIADSIRISKKLVSMLNKVHPDLIHLTSSASFALLKDLLILRIAQKKNIPVIVHFHFGRIPNLAKQKNIEWRFICKVVNRSKKVIVIDENSYFSLVNEGFNNIVLIPNPLSNEVLQYSINNPKPQEILRLKKILFVGHVIKEKGIFELVKACAELENINELIIVGPYEEKAKAEIQNIAEKREKGNWVRMTGAISHVHVLELMNSSPIFVLPSYSEGFPYVVIEALSMKCAVIASNVGAIPEMLNIKSNQPCGICIPSQNVEKLRLSLDHLVNHPELAENLAQLGSNRVSEKYAIIKVFETYYEVWRKSISIDSNY